MKKNQIFALLVLLLCTIAVTACSSRSAMYSSTSWPGAAADGDVVYTANGGLIEAVSGGKKLWSYPESANNRISYYAAPAVDDSRVYAPTYTNRLHIINKADGTLAADIEIGNNKNKVIASPLIAEGSIYVVSSGGMVSSYPENAAGESIAPNWQTTLSNEIWVRPVYDNGTLYVASMDKKMNLLDAATGELKQSVAISGAVMSDPVLSDGKLYFSTLANEVDEMDLASGTVRTILTTTGEIWASPLLMGDKLIAADMNGFVYCADIAAGTTVWSLDAVAEDKRGFIASPTALDSETILLVAENGEILTYDLEGKSIAQRTLGQTVYGTPVILSNGSFAVVPQADNDAQVKAYTKDLKEDWIFSRSAKTESSSESGEENK